MAVEANPVSSDQKPNDKEFNFRALEAKYQKQLNEALQERERLAKEIEEIKQRTQSATQDEVDDEPYVDKRKLNKELAKFGEQTEKKTKNEIQNAVQSALAEERQRMWMQSNQDFYEIMEHANKIVQKDPELAETILQMPDNFERKKLVYRSIKAMGLHKPEEKATSIQDKIDANRRNPYYQPSGIAAAPYASTGDFSPSGMKNSYDKMQELKSRLRLG